MPIVLVLIYKKLLILPPAGSAVRDAWCVGRAAFANGGWKRALRGGNSWWDQAKPSVMTETGTINDRPPGWVNWDDQ